MVARVSLLLIFLNFLLSQLRALRKLDLMNCSFLPRQIRTNWPLLRFSESQGMILRRIRHLILHLTFTSEPRLRFLFVLQPPYPYYTFTFTNLLCHRTTGLSQDHHSDYTYSKPTKKLSNITLKYLL